LKMSKEKSKAFPIKKYVTAFLSVPVPKVARQNTYQKLSDLLKVAHKKILLGIETMYFVVACALSNPY
jgi:hypothetical protein